MLLIIFSLIICCQKRKDDDDKNSYSDDIAIQPYREPEQYGHQNDYYNGTPPNSQSDLRSQQYRYGDYQGYQQQPAAYNNRAYPEPYKGRHDYYTGPPEGYGGRDPYRR